MREHFGTKALKLPTDTQITISGLPDYWNILTCWIVVSGLCYSSWIEDNTFYSARRCSLQSIKLIHSRGTLLILQFFLNNINYFLCIIILDGADVWLLYTWHSDAMIIWLHSMNMYVFINKSLAHNSHNNYPDQLSSTSNLTLDRLCLCMNGTSLYPHLLHCSQVYKNYMCNCIA